MLHTFLLHHFQPFKGLRVEILHVLGPAALYKNVLLELWGSWSLVVIIDLWDSLVEKKHKAESADINSELLVAKTNKTEKEFSNTNC